MASEVRDRVVVEMELIRRRGLGVVQRLNHDMTRLTDWREHVKSTPLPFVVAAAAVGYFIVPSRGNVGRLLPHLQSDQPDDPSERFVRSSTAGQIVSGLRSTVLDFASRWVRTVVGDFVNQQIRSLVKHQNDLTDSQEPTPTNPDGSRRWG